MGVHSEPVEDIHATKVNIVDSSTGRALHQYRGSLGSSFQAFVSTTP